MVIQKYLLSAYTAMMNHVMEINYEYIRDKMPMPYPLQYTNFYSIIVNTYYSVYVDIELKYKAYM